ncbi:MAG: sugar phosphate nucleotidyltransferase [Chitinophagaceae bacterium]
MVKSSLLVLAAGLASRYGGGLKQMDTFGPNKEAFLDYAIYDAIQVGFEEIVFVIRKEFEEGFKEKFFTRWEKKIALKIVYQDFYRFTEGYTVPKTRIKPWGTAHALLCGIEVIKNPFAVINADDFYGRDAYIKAKKMLENVCNDKTWGIIGYQLENTLSDNGEVNRGICKVAKDNSLVNIEETIGIHKKESKIVFPSTNGIVKELMADDVVSMNFFCFPESVFKYCKEGFRKFLEDNIQEPKKEYFIPLLVQEFIEKNGGKTVVEQTDAKWFGVTYKKDAPQVKQDIRKLIEENVYPNGL